MKHDNNLSTSLGRGIAMFFLLATLAVTGFAGDLKSATNITGGGTTTVTGNIVNTSASSGITINPHIKMTGTTTQKIFSVTHKPITFNRNLYLLKSGTKDFTTAVTILAGTGNLLIGDGASAAQDFTGTVTQSASIDSILTIANNATYQNITTPPTAITFGGHVTYSKAGASVLNTPSGASYSTLNLTGSGATVPAVSTGVVSVSTLLNQTTGSLTVNGNVTVTGGASHTIASLGSIANGKSLAFSGSSAGTITALNNASNGTLSSSSSGTITVAGVTGNTGFVVATGGTINFTGTNSSVVGTIDAQTGGIVDFDANIVSTGTVKTTGTGTLKFGGTVSATTLTFASGSTAIYDGPSSTIAVPTSGSYSNLTLGGTGIPTAANNFSVSGLLNVNALTLDLATANKTLTFDDAAATITGAGEVVGAVRRFHTFTTLNNYAFNRDNVYLSTASLAATDITITMTPGSINGTSPVTQYINRKYVITPTNAGNLEAIRLYYANAERVATPDEAKLGFRAFDGVSTWSKLTAASYIRTSGSNIATATGLNSPLTGVTDLGLFQINFVATGNNASLSVAANFDEGSLPTSADDLIINGTGITTVGATALSVASLTIPVGKTLNVDNASGTVTVASTTSLAGTMTVNAANANLAAVTTSGVGNIQVATLRTLTGTSFTNSSSVTSTFTGNVALTSLTNTSGTLAFDGNSSTISTGMSNAAPGIINIGGTLAALTTLGTFTSVGNISVTGSGAFTVGGTGVASILSMTGTSLLDVALGATLTVKGDLEIGSTATFNNEGTAVIGE